MPFTLSHAVIAVPIARLSKQRLPLAGLVVGSMTPDLYRLISDEEGNLAHYWSSQLYPNLILALLFCLLWYGIYRPILYPSLNLSDPLPLQNAKSYLKFTIALIIAILIGNATHLIWDGFTHVDFRTPFGAEFLSQSIDFFEYHAPLHFVLQIASSVLVLPILVWMLLDYRQRHHQAQYVSRCDQTLIATIFTLSLLIGASYCHYYLHHIAPWLW